MKQKVSNGRNCNRSSRDDVMVIEDGVADANGRIVRRSRRRGTIELLWEAGTITHEMREAAEQFAVDFHRAGKSPHGAPWLGERVDGGGAAADGGEAAAAALRRLRAAVDRLGGMGSLMTSCVWHVVGLETAIDEWRQRCSWMGWRVTNRHQAVGVLVAALSLLRKDFT